MFELVLTQAERALLEALNALGVQFLIVGMGAALLEAAPGTTQALDLWFGRIDAEQLREAAARAISTVFLSKSCRSNASSSASGRPQRPKDAAQIPMLEAALAARKARK